MFCQPPISAAELEYGLCLPECWQINQNLMQQHLHIPPMLKYENKHIHSDLRTDFGNHYYLSICNNFKTDKFKLQ